jgi:hypothetical protein
MDNGDIQVFPAEATPSGWLEGQLARAGEAWVTPDSVSMVYEALTAGCRVGLFDLPAKPASRVARGVLALKADGLVSAFPHPPRPNRHPLNEAGRCASLILERWFT